MKLSELERLLGQLALQLTASDLDDLRFQCHNLNQVQKDQATSVIRLFDILRQVSGDTESFLATLERLFSEIEYFGKYVTIIQTCRRNIAHESPREKPRPSRNVSREQKYRFRKTLSSISGRIQRSKLEIMVALSPLPRGSKDGLKEGYKLFDELMQSGFITESDVELLEDFFDVLGMKDAMDLLYQYKAQMMAESSSPSTCSANLLETTPTTWSPHAGSWVSPHTLTASGSHSMPVTSSQVSLPLDCPLTPSYMATFSGQSKRGLSSGDNLETPPPKRLQLTGPKGFSLTSPALPTGGPPMSRGHAPSLPHGPAEPSPQPSSGETLQSRGLAPTGEHRGLAPTGEHRGLTPTGEHHPLTQLSQQAATESLHHRTGQVGVACSPSSPPLPARSHVLIPYTAGTSNLTPLQTRPQHQGHVTGISIEPPFRQDSQQITGGCSQVTNGLHPFCAEQKQGVMETRLLPLATGSTHTLQSSATSSTPTLPSSATTLSLTTGSTPTLSLATGSTPTTVIPREQSNLQEVAAGRNIGGGNVLTSGEIGHYSQPELKRFIPSGEIVCLLRAQSNKETTMTYSGHNKCEGEASYSGHDGEKRQFGHSLNCPGNVSTKAPVHGGVLNNVLTSEELSHHTTQPDQELSHHTTQPDQELNHHTTQPDQELSHHTTQPDQELSHHTTQPDQELSHQESTVEKETGDKKVEPGEESIPPAEGTGDEGSPQTGGTWDKVPQAVCEQTPSLSARLSSSVKNFVASLGDVLTSSD